MLIAIPQFNSVEDKQGALIQKQLMLEALFYVQIHSNMTLQESCEDFKEEQLNKMQDFKITLECLDITGDVIIKSKLAENAVKTLSAKKGFNL